MRALVIRPVSLASEECREGPEFRLRPVAARTVIVALGTFEFNAQEQPRRGSSVKFSGLFSLIWSKRGRALRRLEPLLMI